MFTLQVLVLWQRRSIACQHLEQEVLQWILSPPESDPLVALLLDAFMQLFFFKPELLKTVAYEDVSTYPIGANNEATLRLKPGQVWRAESGPLVMIGVDTGAGPVRVGGKYPLLFSPL
jgi:hypothetical protein